MARVRSRLATDFHPRSTYEVTEASATLASIATGLGNAAPLPDSVRSAPRENVVCQEIEDAFRRPWPGARTTTRRC
ncbi:hypothetical protein [Streptomyces sp. NBC_01445]|uniref:hypothetical protein n=1 Tax=Streptomyces sp. NBC_01445 TaxID=2903869 RepID=UPI002DD853F9|nr:hypothetical protein [Streptomyces sp. NBC_01445]WSE03669.1 hypothetical protein OG574_09985 [Streptomyces sp. NBC_01445]